MEITKYAVEIELMEDMLGTIPKNKEVFKNFIAKKALDLGLEDAVAEELTTCSQLEEKGWTTFHSDKDGPFIYDLMVKGNLCESARTLKTWGTLKQLQDKFKRYTFVFPRRIRLPMPPTNPEAVLKGEYQFPVLERPLRAMTAQGPRVTVTRSDLVPAGTKLKFEVHVLEGAGIKEQTVRDVMDYGKYIGLGQWR